MFEKAWVTWNGAYLFKAFNCHEAINVENNFAEPLRGAKNFLVLFKADRLLSDSHADSCAFTQRWSYASHASSLLSQQGLLTDRV